jgi:hypothetical protein
MVVDLLARLARHRRRIGGLAIADANYLSAGIFIVLFAIAAALRVRERQRAREEG